MTDKNNLLLYVTDPAASAGFYGALLGLKPVEASPAFVLFALPSGFTLGLWKATDVAPAPTTAGGGCEVGFRAADRDAVDATHAAWVDKGAAILMPPRDLEFGRSFVAVDPDGHRLRVYALAGEM